MSPLYLAARENQTAIVEYLLSIENIDVNQGTSENGETALVVAARQGNYKVTEELLLSEKIDVNKGLTTTGLNALIVAAQNGHTRVVQMMIGHPLISMNEGLHTTGVTALVEAIKNDHEDVVAMLLDHTETDVNKRPTNGKSPLIIACSRTNPNIAGSLLSKPGIDVNSATFDGQTALFFAVQGGITEMVELLLRCPKVDTELLDDEYYTARAYAVQNEMANIVSAFESRGAITKEKGHSCCSDKVNRGLLTAVEDGELLWVQTFLRCPQIDINVANQFGMTPLNVAAREGFNDIAHILLSNPSIETNKYNGINGKTALMVASEEGKWELIRMLLSNPQIDVEMTDIILETALQKAVSNGHLMSVKLLLRCPKVQVNGVETENDDIIYAISKRASLLGVGHTCCLDVTNGLLNATILGHSREIRGLLQCPGAYSNVMDANGKTLLYLASWKNHNPAVQVLLRDHNIDANIGVRLDGGTPFSIASEKGHVNVMHKLIKFGNNDGDIDMTIGWCWDNWTPGTVICEDSAKHESPIATTLVSPGSGQ